MAASVPAAELLNLAEDDLFVLAANGNADAQEMMCHRILKDWRPSEVGLQHAEQWAAMATVRGHQLSELTLAQICMVRGTLYAVKEEEEAAVENLAQALAMFDRLSAEGEAYSTRMAERIFSCLHLDGAERLQQAVLRRAKEMQAD